jgi:DNA-binding IclR family transcriptional regulator
MKRREDHQMNPAVMQALAATNGGPGLTAAELAAKLGANTAVMRNTLSKMVFEDKAVTCDRAGRYKLGDPSPLIRMA